jgi:hypothetical protein
MACTIEKAENGKVNKVLNQERKESTLFKQILNTPTLGLDEAIEVYKNSYSKKFKKEAPIEETVIAEPIEQKISDANVEIKKPSFVTVSEMKKAVSSERMIELKDKQDALKSRWQELEKLNNCLWTS